MSQDEIKENKLTAVNNASDLAIAMDDAALDFGGGAGIFDINISLPRGAILGLIGPSGIDGFQSLMLAGESVSGAVWVLLGLITAVTFLLVLLIMRRQYRQVLD